MKLQPKGLFCLSMVVLKLELNQIKVNQDFVFTAEDKRGFPNMTQSILRN